MNSPLYSIPTQTNGPITIFVCIKDRVHSSHSTLMRTWPFSHQDHPSDRPLPIWVRQKMLPCDNYTSHNWIKQTNLKDLNKTIQIKARRRRRRWRHYSKQPTCRSKTSQPSAGWETPMEEMDEWMTGPAYNEKNEILEMGFSPTALIYYIQDSYKSKERKK